VKRKPIIAIVGTGQELEPSISDARSLGCLIADCGWVLITGGRSSGVMKAANEGAKAANGLTIGILPDGRTEISTSVDVAIITDTGEARNNIIVLSADVVVACGVDDPGTASEVALALKAGKPVILVGANQSACSFFREIGGDGVQIAASPEQAVQLINEPIW
jgi:uncharacterized protein (TIGR00725 family)